MKSRYSDSANSIFDKKNARNKIHPIFHLKVSEKDKYANDKQWFKDYVNYIVPFTAKSIQQYREMKLSYEIYNDNLDGYKEELNKFCNPLGENFEQEIVKTFPKLHNNVNVLKGEYLKRTDDHKILLLTAKAIKNKDKQLIAALKKSVEESVQLEIERLQLEMQGMTQDEIEKKVEELRTQETPETLMKTQFLSEQEIFYSKGLKFCKYDQSTKAKQMETLQDVVTVDRCFIYSGFKHGKPYIEVRNPLNCIYHKSPDQMFTHKGDYFAYIKEISITECLDNYGHLLNDDEASRLSVHTYHRGIDHRHALGPHNEQFVYDKDHINQAMVEQHMTPHDKTTGLSEGEQNIYVNNPRTITETHIEFKAYKELIFLTYTDDYNDVVTTLLSKDFPIPKSAEKIKFTNKYGHESVKYEWIDEVLGTTYSAEIIHLPRKYEAIRLNGDVFPVVREVPFQSTSLTNPFSDFNLSTFGAVFTARNAKSISLLQRAIPSYFQYLYVKHIQNRELAKYQGYIQNIDVDQIPQQLGQDVDGNFIKDPIAVHQLYMKKLGKNYYSGSQTLNGGQVPATRSPGSTGFILGTAAEIFNLQQLLQMIDVEISMSMGISPQRLSQFSQDSNVSDNRQAITQSHHITEPYFFYLNELWRDVYHDYLKNFRTYCKNNPDSSIFHYILPDGSEEVLNVTPDMLLPTDIGIFVTNSQSSEQYNNIMLQLSHSFGQNQGEGIEAVSMLIKAITQGSSPEETHKLIQIESTKQSKRLQEREQINAKVQQEYLMKVQEREDNVREDMQEHDIQKEHVKGQYKIESDIIKASGYGADVNDNGVPDTLELAKFQHQIDQDKIKNKQEDKKIAIQKKNKNTPSK